MKCFVEKKVKEKVRERERVKKAKRKYPSWVRQKGTSKENWTRRQEVYVEGHV